MPSLWKIRVKPTADREMSFVRATKREAQSLVSNLKSQEDEGTLIEVTECKYKSGKAELAAMIEAHFGNQY